MRGPPPATRTKATRIKKTGSRRRTHKAQHQRLPLFRSRRDGTITQEMSDPNLTNPGYSSQEASFIDARTWRVFCCSSKTRDHRQGQRRRPCKDKALNPSSCRGQYHPTMSGKKNTILSSGLGSDPQKSTLVNSLRAQRLEEADAPTTRCLHKKNKKTGSKVLLWVLNYDCMWYLIVLYVLDSQKYIYWTVGLFAYMILNSGMVWI